MLLTNSSELVNTELYNTFDISEATYEMVYEFMKVDVGFDGYCPECEKESTFKSTKSKYMEFTDSVMKAYCEEEKIVNKEFYCTRFNSHKIVFFYKIMDMKITKIGQTPSTADLSNNSIKIYRKLLGKEGYKEFNRAIGLSSHGIGIGSFVYLRRIFERLIEEAHQEAVSEDSNWNEENYIRSRMQEKISILKDYLPIFLTKAKGLYPILSKGIHELSEEECQEMFPAIKLGIELILDERIEQINRKNKIKEAEKAISSYMERYT
ncbi:hypothetical protein UY286_21410 [Paenibacillus polymyxa]|uniref:hypothetical protein n=1 Tax=Paenibacillus polymyxa TaxID=1406 RepID=UPI002AB5AC45|nr:hypothetical protein [Paenibacillus polymyxa]MDY7993401.1 hypothetical protein [Paenibacillus polymyxa]MDY8119998.1 hypothetical protein [Paenibacillus polymyxa]